MGHLCQLLPQAQGTLKKGQKEQLEDGRAVLRNVASEYGMVTAMNQKQLWFSAHDLYQMKPVNIPACMGEAHDAVSPLKCQSLGVDLLRKRDCCQLLVGGSGPTLT